MCAPILQISLLLRSTFCGRNAFSCCWTCMNPMNSNGSNGFLQWVSRLRCRMSRKTRQTLPPPGSGWHAPFGCPVAWPRQNGDLRHGVARNHHWCSSISDDSHVMIFMYHRYS
jgi:hypothetical protein